MTCEVQYSRRVGALVAAAALATWALTFAMPLAVLPHVALLLWVLLVACRAVRRLGEVRGLRLEEEGAIEVLGAEGAWMRGRLRPGSCVLPWLTVVRWRVEGGWVDRNVLLLPSMVNVESFRALRVLLRWQKP